MRHGTRGRRTRQVYEWRHRNVEFGESLDVYWPIPGKVPGTTGLQTTNGLYHVYQRQPIESWPEMISHHIYQGVETFSPILVTNRRYRYHKYLDISTLRRFLHSTLAKSSRYRQNPRQSCTSLACISLPRSIS